MFNAGKVLVSLVEAAFCHSWMADSSKRIKQLCIIYVAKKGAKLISVAMKAMQDEIL